MENPAEVQELRNKLRMMGFPQDDILNTVRRQQRAIHKQKQANETIREEINQYESDLASIEKLEQSYMNSEARQNIVSKRKNLTNKLGILQADFKAEDDKRRNLEEEVSKARSRCGGMFAQARENEEIQNKLHTLENRLDVSYNRYNKYLTKLGQLRKEIDELRQERFTFRNIYNRALNNEKEKDMQIEALINESNEAYTLRDQFKMETVEIKNSDKQHQQKYEQEIERFNTMIEGQEVISRRPKNVQPIPTLMSQTTASLEASESLQKDIDEMNQKIERTLKLTKCKDLEELFDKIADLEQENYSLFSFVVDYGSEKSDLVDAIDKLEEHNTDLVFENDALDANQNDLIQSLTEEMAKTDAELKEYKEIKENNDKELKEVYKDVEKLFNEVGCSWDNAPDDKNHVTSNNVLFCISEIEKAFSDLMIQVSTRASVIPIKEETRIVVTDALRSTSRLPTISKSDANYAMISKASLTDSKPLTPEDLRQRLGIIMQ